MTVLAVKIQMDTDRVDNINTGQLEPDDPAGLWDRQRQRVIVRVRGCVKDKAIVGRGRVAGRVGHGDRHRQVTIRESADVNVADREPVCLAVADDRVDASCIVTDADRDRDDVVIDTAQGHRHVTRLGTAGQDIRHADLDRQRHTIKLRGVIQLVVRELGLGRVAVDHVPGRVREPGVMGKIKRDLSIEFRERGRLYVDIERRVLARSHLRRGGARSVHHGQYRVTDNYLGAMLVVRVDYEVCPVDGRTIDRLRHRYLEHQAVGVGDAVGVRGTGV